MSINTQSLFDQKASAFGQPRNSVRFTSDFINAVNRALSDLHLLALIDTTAIDDVEENIDLDAKYEATLSVGVDYHLLMIGQQSAMDKKDTFQMFRDMARTAQMTQFEDAATAETLEVKLGDLSD